MQSPWRPSDHFISHAPDCGDEFSCLCPGKNNILHISAAELFCTLFSQNPPDSISYIAFSTSIWTYNPCNSIMKFKVYFLCKRFKTLHFNVF